MCRKESFRFAPATRPHGTRGQGPRSHTGTSTCASKWTLRQPKLCRVGFCATTCQAPSMPVGGNGARCSAPSPIVLAVASPQSACATLSRLVCACSVIETDRVFRASTHGHLSCTASYPKHNVGLGCALHTIHCGQVGSFEYGPALARSRVRCGILVFSLCCSLCLIVLSRLVIPDKAIIRAVNLIFQ